MNQIDQEALDTAITLGDAVCRELGICCGQRGQVIFRIYRKLREMNPNKDTAAGPEVPDAQKADGVSSSTMGGA